MNSANVIPLGILWPKPHDEITIAAKAREEIPAKANERTKNLIEMRSKNGINILIP